jgi:hypothetical protein
MPHLVQLSLYAPRLEGLEAEALAALTGLSRLELTGAYNGAVYGAPLPLPQPWALSGLVGLKELSLDNIIMHGEMQALDCSRPRGVVHTAATLGGQTLHAFQAW